MKNISGERVFKLYDTYGFPWELTQEIAAEKGLSVDKAGFEAAMAEQKERARAARAKVSAKVATPDTTKLDISSLSTIDEDGTTKLLLVGKDGKELASAADGTEITAILLNTPSTLKAADRLVIQASLPELKVPLLLKYQEAS